MTPSQVQLLVMVIQLLSVMLMGAVVSAWLLRNYFSWPLVIGSFVVTIILIFVMVGVAGTGNTFATLIIGTLFGAAIGADLGGFTLAVTDGRKRGREAVAITLAIVAGSTVMAAAVGMFTGYNFQGWGGPLFIGLLLLIGVGLFQLFVRLNRITELIIGAVASLFWVIYLIYDFNKVVDLYEEATWSAAAEIAMNVFLDMVNLFVRLLPIIAELLED